MVVAGGAVGGVGADGAATLGCEAAAAAAACSASSSSTVFIDPISGADRPGGPFILIPPSLPISSSKNPLTTLLLGEDVDVAEEDDVDDEGGTEEGTEVVEEVEEVEVDGADDAAEEDDEEVAGVSIGLGSKTSSSPHPPPAVFVFDQVLSMASPKEPKLKANSESVVPMFPYLPSLNVGA
jgi:hypothetical protein